MFPQPINSRDNNRQIQRDQMNFPSGLSNYIPYPFEYETPKNVDIYSRNLFSYPENNSNIGNRGSDNIGRGNIGSSGIGNSGGSGGSGNGNRGNRGNENIRFNHFVPRPEQIPGQIPRAQPNWGLNSGADIIPQLTRNNRYLQQEEQYKTNMYTPMTMRDYQKEVDERNDFLGFKPKFSR